MRMDRSQQNLPQLFLEQGDDEWQNNIAEASDNLFLTKANAIFIVVARLQLMPVNLDAAMFQKDLLQMVAQFEKSLQTENLRAEQIFLVKYFICALLDDVIAYDVLRDPSLWRPYSLLLCLFQDGNADERFFVLLDRLQAEPTMNLALLEYVFMILIYGYQGKYRQLHNGRIALLEKTDELYHVLNWHHGDMRKSLLVQRVS